MVKNPPAMWETWVPCNVGDLGLIPGLGRSPGEGNGYPLQYSGLENSMDKGAWRATAHGVAKSWTWLNDFTFTGSLADKESACNSGDLGSIPGLGRSPGEGNGYPLQFSGLENSMDKGAWQATVRGITKSWRPQSNFHFRFRFYRGWREANMKQDEE